MQKIEIDNLKLGYVIIGDGPLVVLLHGYGGNHLDWMEVIEGLSEGYTYLVINYKNLFLQKKGMSFSTQQVYVMKFINEIIKNHDLAEDFHIISTSYGSALGLSLQIQIKENINSHIMINPMPYNPMRKIKSFPVRALIRVSRHHFLFKSLIKTKMGKQYLKTVCDIFGLGEITEKSGLRKIVFIRRAIENFFNTVKGEDWNRYYDLLGDLSDSDVLAYISVSDELFSKMSYDRFLKKLSKINVCYLNGAGHLVIKSDPNLISHFINEHLKNYLSINKEVS